MAGIESWGTSVILWLQSFSGPLTDQFFRAATLLGDERFYLLLLPLIYWCLDKRLGIRLAFLVLFSNAVNLIAKHTFALPRPPAPPVRPIGSEVGPGFPSGHTQAATVTAGYAARRSGRRWAYAVAGLLAALVGLSRLYLGVHFPHDVLGGLIIGLALLAAYEYALPRVERRWRRWPAWLRYGLILGLPVLAALLWPVDDMASSAGALAGFALGAVFEDARVRFDPGGPLFRRALRLLLGLVVVGGLYGGLKVVFPAGLAWRFIRYGCIGLFAAGLAPWLFVRLGLARAEAALVREAR